MNLKVAPHFAVNLFKNPLYLTSFKPPTQQPALHQALAGGVKPKHFLNQRLAPPGPALSIAYQSDNRPLLHYLLAAASCW